MISKADLYSLCFNKNAPCFQAFDPSIYTEVRGYQNNPAFQKEAAFELLGEANKALACFTRGTQYEFEVQERYTFKNDRQKQKELREGRDFLPEFITLFQAFKRHRSDFESAVFFCCDYLSSKLDDQAYRHTKLLIQGGQKLSLTTESGNNYMFPNLLAAFALWKFDRAMLAMQKGMASDVAILLLDARCALEAADHFYQNRIKELDTQKRVSEKKSQNASAPRKNHKLVKEKVIGIYKSKEWPSVRQAAMLIYKQLDLENQKLLHSEERAYRLISDWVSEEDPTGKFVRYEKKKSCEKSSR